MNPSWVKTQADRQKVYREYIASLNLDQQNINKTADALKTKELTGAVPQMRDTRTTTEKYMDTNRLKNELESGLYEIMSPDEASKVVSQLTQDEILFGRTQLPQIVKDLKPRFALGVPSIIFLNYLRKTLEKFILTEGVETASGQPLGVPSNALFTAFADIRDTKASLEKLLKAMEYVYKVYYGPERPPAEPSSTPIPPSSALVPFRRVEEDLRRVISLLPSDIDFQTLRNLNINTRNDVYNIISDFERYFPNSQLIGNMLQNLMNTTDRDELVRIADGIRQQINLTPQQENDLKQIKDIAGQQESEALVPIESRAGGRRIVVTGKKEVIKVPKKRETPLPELEGEQLKAIEPAPAPVEENKFKMYEGDEKPLLQSQQKKILDFLETFGYPLSKEKFLKLNQENKHTYLARAIQVNDLPMAYGKVKEIDPETGLQYKTILYPRGMLTKWSTDGPGYTRNTPRFKTKDLNDIYEEYLSLSAPQEEPIQEFSGTPSKSIISEMTPAGVASTFSPQRGKEKKGKGIRGRGLTKNRVAGRLEREPEPKSAYSFAPMGRYVINTNKLQKNILTINTKTGKSLPRLKSKSISKTLAEIFKEIAKGNEITNEQTNDLTEEEIDTLYNVLNECQLLSKYNSPTSQNLSNTEKELHRFMILKGQIMAGQNNDSVVREFKALLLKYMKNGQIPRGEGYEILQELLLLGY